ncbi:amino acid ABC transporter substrate-binding protein [Anaerovorax odorimutans]|uniref:amino acid ABC transporter substrate-binding protein n=1 Tax=Anaerovorax odorimutans TaxID=109327 RepID=UPI00041FE488|nr:amino acid ABC transporter substrate-binding protein [Anaerovorax odorimutans]
MFKKISLLLVLVLILSIFAAGCGNDNDVKSEDNNDAAKDTSLTDIQDKGTLVVGCDTEFPPMGFIGDDGELTGFDLELAALVAEKLGVKSEPKAINWDTKEIELNNGNIDVIWNGYTIKKDRNEKVEYTKPYLNNQQVLVVAADSPYEKKSDLEGKTVGAQVKSAGLDALKADDLASTLKAIPEYEAYTYALMDLETSRLDALAVDKILIRYAMQQNPGKYKVLDEGLCNEYYGIGCAKGAVALREAIDKALDELQEDGSIDKLSKKWFGENLVVRDVEKLTDADFE